MGRDEDEKAPVDPVENQNRPDDATDDSGDDAFREHLVDKRTGRTGG